MSAYSVVLRARIVRAVEQGMSKAEAARRYEVGLSTVKRYVRLGVGGSLVAKASPGRPRAIDAGAEAALRAQVAAHPDATVEEHRGRWARERGVAVSRVTLGRALARAGLPRKKTRLANSPCIG